MIQHLLGDGAYSLESAQSQFDKGDRNGGWVALLDAYESLARAEEHVIMVVTAPDVTDAQLERFRFEDLAGRVHTTLGAVRGTIMRAVAPQGDALPIDLKRTFGTPQLMLLEGGRKNPITATKERLTSW